MRASARLGHRFRRRAVLFAGRRGARALRLAQPKRGGRADARDSGRPRRKLVARDGRLRQQADDLVRARAGGRAAAEVPRRLHAGGRARRGRASTTSCVLEQAGVPQPKYLVAFTQEGALDAVERLGYPAVCKPVSGSWGRLLAKLNDRESAEAVFEHKAMLGAIHNTFYIQEFVDKGSFDVSTESRSAPSRARASTGSRTRRAEARPRTCRSTTRYPSCFARCTAR